MKKLLLILLCVPLIGLGQESNVDSLKKEIDDINYRMDLHHKNYSTGMILTTLGAISTVVGSTTNENSLILAGSIVSFIGSLIVWDSHKWFGSGKIRNNRINKRKEQLNYLYNSGRIDKQEYEEAIEDLNLQ